MTSANDQMLLPNIPPPNTEDRGSEAPWLGLVTDHRRLFDALQDGWLRPLESLAGMLLGVGKYAPERRSVSASHPILVRMKLDISKLPALDANVFCAAFRFDRAAKFDEEISAWLRATCSILRAESVIQLDEWRDCPVGIAIQLVLTRPEPIAFKTWFRDRPDLPPAIGWSAAALCGLLHGYRRLDTQFRGKAIQRELLSIHALRTCAAEMQEIDWPACTAEGPRWRKDADAFVLSWGDREFARKPIKERGRWFAADFEDVRVMDEAHRISKKSDWPCAYRILGLRDVEIPVSGSGNVRVLTELSPRIAVEGEIRLPKSIDIEEKFDTESFRHLIATEAGRFPDPPIPPTHQIRNMQVEQTDVPGLTYARDFLSEREEEDIVAAIDRCDWHSDLKRRVQHYGWRYDHKARQIDPSMRLGSLPEWADHATRCGHPDPPPARAPRAARRARRTIA